MGLFSGLLNLLFPPKCVLCRRVVPRAGICETCAQKTNHQTMERRGTFFIKCAVSLHYEAEVRDAIHRFKFGDQPGYATAFGNRMAQTIREKLPGEYDLITWVPVSEKRRKERGYDQAMLLALSTALSLEDVAVETLKKLRHNAAQSTLDHSQQRKENVLGAYEITDPELIAGKRILLIDDVVTTGATLEEASRTLLRGGASHVVAAALASPMKMKNQSTTEEGTL